MPAQSSARTFLTAPTVQHGPGALSQLGAALARLGGRKPFLVTGPGLVRAGLAGRVYEAIGDEIRAYDRVQPEPGHELVRECVAMVQEHGDDAVIGLVGGSLVACAPCPNRYDVSIVWSAGARCQCCVHAELVGPSVGGFDSHRLIL